MLSNSIERAQKKVEERNFDIRKDLLKYDNVMNEQRKIIYAERKEIMEQEDVSETIKEMRDEYLSAIINAHAPYATPPEEWNKDDLKQDILAATSFSMPIENWCNNPDIDSETLKETILQEVDNRLAEREKDLPITEKLDEEENIQISMFS